MNKSLWNNIRDLIILLLITAFIMLNNFYICKLYDTVQELNSYMKSHNTRINKLEQFELWKK